MPWVGFPPVLPNFLSHKLPLTHKYPLTEVSWGTVVKGKSQIITVYSYIFLFISNDNVLIKLMRLLKRRFSVLQNFYLKVYSLTSNQQFRGYWLHAQLGMMESSDVILRSEFWLSSIYSTQIIRGNSDLICKLPVCVNVW